MRRCMSSDSTEGTIRSLSPLAIKVGWVIFDRSAGAERPHFLIALSCVWSVLTETWASRSTVRSLSRLTNARAAGLPVALRLKNRNSFGSDRVRVARRMSQYVIAGDLVDVLPAGRAGPGEDQLADEIRVLGHECLGDHAAEGEGEDVDLVEAERADEGVGVVGHRLDAVGNLAGGGADAAVVERDDVVLPGDRVDDARVPVVQVRREVDEEDHGDPALRPELTIGVGHAAGGDGAGRCLRVGRDDGVVAGGAHGR